MLEIPTLVLSLAVPTVCYAGTVSDIEASAVPAGPPERLHGLASWLLNQARVVGDRQVAARFGRTGIRTDYAVLATLDAFGPLSQAEIGRRLGIDRSDVVALLNRLAAEGLVLREQDPDDRRRNTISLTAAGTERLAEMDGQVARAQDDLLAPLDDDDQVTLVRLLQRVVDHHHGRVPGG